jgi:hypothetical protein
MATVEKDFKVKNGLIVTSGGEFGGTVVIATPTENNHAATKAYVDGLTGNPLVPVEASAPVEPATGQMYIDSETGRLTIFNGTSWITFATLTDAETIPQHIHDTSIGGSGLIVSTFVDGGFYNSPAGSPLDAGFYNETNWDNVLDGGLAVDNFN